MSPKSLPLALLVLLGCTDTGRFTGECQKNGECPVGSACKISQSSGTGICVCRSDEACDPGEVCNSQGICQKRAGCRSNADCEAAKFCDVGTGACIDRTACGSDVHCLPGTVCEGNRCVDGCHDTGDCPLYTICQGGTPTTLGSCLAGKCDDKSFCDFGSDCVGNACSVDPDPNFCSLDCNGNQDCGDGGRNFCLVNSAYDPQNPRSSYQTFCGVECDPQVETACPNGYNCGGVVLLTQDQCVNDSECGGEGRRCFLGEGDLRGFCSCVDDQDCAFENVPPTCLGSCGGLGITPCTTDGECLTTCQFTCQNPAGRACTNDSECQPLPLCQQNRCITDGSSCGSGADCLCLGGSCINTGRPCQTGSECNPPCVNGGCLLGAACAPDEGLLCTDVR